MSSESYLDSLYSSKESAQPAKKPRPSKSNQSQSLSAASPHPIDTRLAGVPALSISIADLFRRHHLTLNSKRYTNDETYEKQVFEKVIPLDNFFSGKKTKLKPAPKTGVIGARKAKETSLYDMSTVTYAAATTLNLLWREYIKQATLDKPVTLDLLKQVDLHGAEVQVTESKNISNIGIKGFIVRDAANSFSILSPDGLLRILPKDVCKFRLSLEPPFEIDGPTFIRK